MSQPAESAEGGFSLPRIDLPDATTALTLVAVVVALLIANLALRRWQRVKRLHHDLTMISLTLLGIMIVAWSFESGLRVGEHFGRVSERGLFFTEIQNEARLKRLENRRAWLAELIERQQGEQAGS